MDYKKLKKLLDKHDGNKSAVARELGQPRKTVCYHIDILHNKQLTSHVEGARSPRKSSTHTKVPKGVFSSLLSDGVGLKIDNLDGHVSAKTKKTIDLIISDTQAPFQHPDTLRFLEAVKERYRPTRVFHVGDLIDSINFKFHEKDPDEPGLAEEMVAVEQFVEQLSDMFPDMYIAEGNHDLRIYRKAAAAGIPRKYVRGLNELIGAPKGWKWRSKWTIEFSNGEKAVLLHNCGHKDATKGVQAYGYSVIQGHYATVSEVRYQATRDKLMFGMTVGASIDKKAVAFNYNRLDIKRPIMSHALIEDGQPRLLPMQLDETGRWTGQL